jgi:hypothetical protein
MISIRTSSHSFNNATRLNIEKYGDLKYGWDIDHIIPISKASTKADVLKLNHFSNFQPLCSKINRDIKRDKLDENMSI